MAKKDTYIAGQTIHNRIELDENGNRVMTQRVIYEQREFIDGYVDVRLPKKHKYNNGGFITIFQDAIRLIVRFGKLNKSEMALLLWMVGTAEIDGSVETNLDVLKTELNLDKGNISKALKGLVQRNIIIRKDGNRYDREPLPMELSFNYDQINYNLAYNGKTSQYNKKKNKHPALSIPGENKNEWEDTMTGETTIEVGGKIVQRSISFDEENE